MQIVILKWDLVQRQVVILVRWCLWPRGSCF